MISLQRSFGSVKWYLSRYGGKDPGVVVSCLICGRRMNQHGSYRRNVWGRRRCDRIPIYRRYCRRCKVTVSLSPDFIKPHGRVENGCREMVIRLQLDGKVSVEEISRRFNVSKRTIYRWKWQARKVADAVLPGMLVEAAGISVANPGPDQGQGEAAVVPAANPGPDQGQGEAAVVPAATPGTDQVKGVCDRDIKLKEMLRLADVLYRSICTPQYRYPLHLTALSYVNWKFCPASAKDCA